MTGQRGDPLEPGDSLGMVTSGCTSETRLSVRSHNSKTAWPNFTKFLCILPAAVARSSSDGVAISCVLPVLRMSVFSYHGANGPESSTTLFRRVRQVAIPVRFRVRHRG